MKKTLLTLLLGLLTFTAVHAQHTVVIERPGIFTDLATALVGVPATAVTGIVVGTVEAAGSLIHGSTEIVVVPPARPISPPMVVTPAPSWQPLRLPLHWLRQQFHRRPSSQHMATVP